MQITEITRENRTELQKFTDSGRIAVLFDFSGMIKTCCADGRKAQTFSVAARV